MGRSGAVSSRTRVFRLEPTISWLLRRRAAPCRVVGERAVIEARRVGHYATWEVVCSQWGCDMLSKHRLAFFLAFGQMRVTSGEVGSTRVILDR